MILFPRPHLWIPRRPAPLLMAPPWDEEAARALEYTDNISCGMPAVVAACGGIIPTITSPNNMNVGWTQNGITFPLTNKLAPDGSFTASDMIAASTAGAGGINWNQSLGALSTSTLYRMTAYVEAISGSPWLKIQFSDQIANAFHVYFNASTGLFGTAGIGASCSIATPEPNGYFKVDFAGSFGALAGPVTLFFYMVDSDGGLTGTINQEFYVWGVGQTVP